MKVIRKDKLEGFRPVTLEITFETISELKTMWNLLNVSDEEVSNESERYPHLVEVVEVADFHSLFDEIGRELL